MSTYRKQGPAPRESRHIEIPVMQRRELGEGAVVHYLRAGRTPCGMPGLPGEWPREHFWSIKGSDITCGACKAALR